MRLLSSCVIAITCFAPAALASTKPAAVSWGKPGVTLEQYRQDAVECGTAAYTMDLSGTEAAKVLKRATRELENNEANLQTLSGNWGYTQMQLVQRSAWIIHAARPTLRFREVRELQEQGLAVCLTDRGYKRFSLTKEQQDHLRRLKAGSPERHQYLYSLSVDPMVLGEPAT